MAHLPVAQHMHFDRAHWGLVVSEEVTARSLWHIVQMADKERADGGMINATDLRYTESLHVRDTEAALIVAEAPDLVHTPWRLERRMGVGHRHCTGVDLVEIPAG